MLFAAYKIIKINFEYRQSNNSYLDLRNYIESSQISESNEDESVEDVITENLSMDFPSVNFQALRDINSDIVGWIIFEGSAINYPIVQGEDNSYYLKHLFTGEYSVAGCLFLDCNNAMDFSDRNSVVYGHHMRDETMFTSIADYKKQDYYDSHPQAILLTPTKNYRIELFAGFVANVNDDAWKTEFESDVEFWDWLKDLQKRSCFTSTVVPLLSDRIVTFSTCSYEFENARFVLYGVVR